MKANYHDKAGCKVGMIYGKGFGGCGYDEIHYPRWKPEKGDPKSQLLIRLGAASFRGDVSMELICHWAVLDRPVEIL